MDPGQQSPAACVHMHCILLHMHANIILLFVCAHVALSTLAEDACFPIPPPQTCNRDQTCVAYVGIRLLSSHHKMNS